MANNKVLITGICGQDGAYLSKLLLDHGYSVTGTCRKTSAEYFWRLRKLGILDKVELVDLHIGQSAELSELISNYKFDYIFHLAGESFTADSFNHPYRTMNTNIHGAIEVLEAVRYSSSASRVFLAGSSEIFENNSNYPKTCNENSEVSPKSPYGVSQLANREFARIYREAYGLFVSYGILFNHESPLRADFFVTKKIANAFSQMSSGGLKTISLGNLDAAKDFGDSRNFVEAFLKIMYFELPSEFVVATGKLTTVRDLVTISAKFFGFEPIFEGEGIQELCIDQKTGRILAQVDGKFFRPLESNSIYGDTSKLNECTGWSHTRSMTDTMIEMCSESQGNN